MKDHLKYTLFLISEYGDCAASKDKLIEAVRINQAKQTKRENR